MNITQPVIGLSILTRKVGNVNDGYDHPGDDIAAARIQPTLEIVFPDSRRRIQRIQRGRFRPVKAGLQREWAVMGR